MTNKVIKKVRFKIAVFLFIITSLFYLTFKHVNTELFSVLFIMSSVLLYPLSCKIEKKLRFRALLAKGKISIDHVDFIITEMEIALERVGEMPKSRDEFDSLFKRCIQSRKRPSGLEEHTYNFYTLSAFVYLVSVRSKEIPSFLDPLINAFNEELFVIIQVGRHYRKQNKLNA